MCQLNQVIYFQQKIITEIIEALFMIPDLQITLLQNAAHADVYPSFKGTTRGLY